MEPPIFFLLHATKAIFMIKSVDVRDERNSVHVRGKGLLPNEKGKMVLLGYCEMLKKEALQYSVDSEPFWGNLLFNNRSNLSMLYECQQTFRYETSRTPCAIPHYNITNRLHQNHNSRKAKLSSP